MRNPWKLTTFVLAILLAVVVGRTSFTVAAASAETQPHMKQALDSLEAALGDLEKATADKGGHRTKAMSLTKQAISETKKGVAFDNKH